MFRGASVLESEVTEPVEFDGVCSSSEEGSMLIPSFPGSVFLMSLMIRISRPTRPPCILHRTPSHLCLQIPILSQTFVCVSPCPHPPVLDSFPTDRPVPRLSLVYPGPVTPFIFPIDPLRVHHRHHRTQSVGGLHCLQGPGRMHWVFTMLRRTKVTHTKRR
jgi:hypothetical protein